jgi:sugar O-acyltransferase (sialic acid O-acetyltransferase NeuD family)
MKHVVIFGTGDIGQIAKYYFETDTDFRVVAFTVDAEFMDKDSFENLPVVPFGSLEKSFRPADALLFIATSYSRLNKIRAAKYEQARVRGYKFASYISSRCTYLSQFRPGDNSFIFEDNTVQPYVKIGNNVTLWSGNHVGHHSTIDDHNFISSHVVISGHCHVEPYCFIGVNATLHNNVRIATENLIGAGAIITKSTRPKEVHLPAKSSVFAKKSDELDF